MAEPIDIVILGTGSFAARILFDLAATANAPLILAVAGRSRDRLDWLRTAASARAHMFGRPLRCITRTVDLLDPDATMELLERCRPGVVVQAASLQSGSVISATGNAWSQIVAEGGLSATAIFQALLSMRVAQALRRAYPAAQLINCCFPDVVNGIIAAAGLPIACGIGNVAILAHAFAGALPEAEGRSLKVLAHYQTIAPWRRPKQDRSGPLPRAWIGDEELVDVLTRFAEVRLTPEPVIDISGASGAALIEAMAVGAAWQGHAPGPNGLLGGYPVRLRAGELMLDLPAGLPHDEAVAWNSGFEATNGLFLEHGRVRYTGRLYERLRRASPELAEGFAVADIDTVYDDMAALRTRLQAQTSLD
ncbi:MAG: hypothetical protein JO058_04550 [Alphaproteobacteria bacterium]|nr:hypothetical protein [Alphaproteobacteria bacterium]